MLHVGSVKRISRPQFKELLKVPGNESNAGRIISQVHKESMDALFELTAARIFRSSLLAHVRANSPADLPRIENGLRRKAILLNSEILASHGVSAEEARLLRKASQQLLWTWRNRTPEKREIDRALARSERGRELQKLRLRAYFKTEKGRAAIKKYRRTPLWDLTLRLKQVNARIARRLAKLSRKGLSQENDVLLARLLKLCDFLEARRAVLKDERKNEMIGGKQ